MGLSDFSTPKCPNINEESSLMTSDMSQVTEISTCNESSDSMLGEQSQDEVNTGEIIEIVQKQFRKVLAMSHPTRCSG